MQPTGYDIPDAELGVLKLLWDRGESTVRELRERLYPGGGTSEHATVQKLLDRLAARGCVGRRREGRASVWQATVDRPTVIRDRLEDAARRLCNGSLTPLLTQLVSHGDWSPQDLAGLRELVRRLEDEP